MKQLFTSFRLLMITTLIGSPFFYTFGQTSITINARDYSEANPFVFPNYPDRSMASLHIKRDKTIYITFPGVIVGYRLIYNPDGGGSGIPSNVLNIQKMTKPGMWDFEYMYNGTTIKTTAVILNYQVDIQDQTIGSATYGDYPDFIWVNAGESATVCTGPNFVLYGWHNYGESNTFSQGETDSIKAIKKGRYIGRTLDATFNDYSETTDTISILEKPTINGITKTVSFPTTTTGITYKLMKVGSISGTDTTWTEIQSFLGDGNVKNITLTDGKYKLTTTFGIHTAVYPYGYFVVGVTTAFDKTKEENINYRLVDNKLQFDNEVNLEFYSLQGQLLQQGQGSSFKLCRQVGIFKATDKNGNVLTAKIILN